ncbi:phage integrase N-terminal SAM-like domain-containing protein [Shimia aestuarii]|uniref:phage integrase N-terminal SAM-like domain-containing protein n=1 Tax=Shimia aestuarii TaxID=254406 RepID=UPI001FB24731|nr:phage integrase N-terminal SAM-like domain-containing protein [Shimia aestuarii]
MSRSYRNVCLSLNRVYTVNEVQVLYDVCRNTVSNWVREGLRPSDDSFPQLFRGTELKRFHDARVARARRGLRFGEFKCVGCGAAVFPDVRSVRLEIVEGRRTFAHATCCDCGARVLKFLGATECTKVQECLDTNTELSEIDEYQAALPARIGKDKGGQDVAWFTSNDRIIHEWQIYAGRFSEKTQQAYLVSIREFEEFIGGESFDKVTTKRAGAYRDHLVELHKRPKESGGLSSSTVRHRASHLSAFFKWLRGQTGYRRLSASIPDYFALPRATSGVGLKERQKIYPSLDEAWAMVDGMPARTLTQRRDRAMVAFAFVSGFCESRRQNGPQKRSDFLIVAE